MGWLGSQRTELPDLRSLLRELRKEVLYLLPITRPRKVFFDHVPKCGGTSIVSYLRAHYPCRKVFLAYGSDARDEFVRLAEHMRRSLGLIAGHQVDMLLDSVDSSFTVATLLRDPVERIVSVYYYVRHRQVIGYIR